MSQLLRPAKTLQEVPKVLSNKPLENPEEITAFYRHSINAIRGDDYIQMMALSLKQLYGSAFYKACLYGHPGSGKSTELTRLIMNVQDQFLPLRFSVNRELDPAAFKPFDVIFLIMAEVLRKTTASPKEGGEGLKVSEQRLKEVKDWFSHEQETVSSKREKSFGVEATADASLLAQVLNLFGGLKGEIRFATSRQTDIVTYRLERLSELTNLANRLLDECNSQLMNNKGKEWLIIGEDFDKSGIDFDLTRSLFLNYRTVFDELRAHMVFTVPVSLVYSRDADDLPFTKNNRHCMLDVPVYFADHSPNVPARKALAEILNARMSPDLFDENQQERIIVASGGSIRSMFDMTLEATNRAIINHRGTIGSEETTKAITNLRREFTRRLGSTEYDTEELSYALKAKRLVAIYNQDKEASQIPDSITYSLLRSRALQEFNGNGWYGVHPLVVDVLADQGKIKVSKGGMVPGGSI